MSTVKLRGISTVVLDIEGTLCPIWFVARVLYPYATSNLRKVVTSQWNEEAFQPYKAAFPDDVRDAPESVISHCQALAAKDIKDPAWKKLQGLIWRQGYADGVLAVPLFGDVTPRLKAWRQDGYLLAIFSSGSVEAQKLFFRYIDPNADLSQSKGESDDDNVLEGASAKTEGRAGEALTAGDKQMASEVTKEGAASAKKSWADPELAAEAAGKSQKQVQTQDLSGLFDANFDTVNAGSKVVAESYTKIVKELGKDAGECLFLSDNVKEIAAAKEAGLHAILVDRPGNAALSEEDRRNFDVVESLDMVELTKRP
ncbi:2,3-diketo-5-methylthio-1-phosphopentane phosphatase [Verruconis gallopava]|uniref:2,3-diketo-5-methylthio-1-phosphopentane phosphatase n=1 Tax=Verruconis gallopava TaxID=253628 RepID=A0A0D1ZX16_9PEZI|nr:2,3-diketo-5-methylthio-1-phosphopentane phosphatase [Verruconis gallopava]KIV98992.1 2,3-diketo-5-methylthio-1-phosphopentane phosphatase [Verruconis gallopava]